MSSDSHYSAVDDPEAHPPTSARRSSRADMEESAGSSSTNIEVKLLPSSSEEVNPFDTESVPRSPSQAAQWHSGDLNEPLYTEASSSNSVLPPLFPSLGPLVATTAHPSTAGSWTSKISFYLFLIVFYIGSKGLSQLFASYVASREHLAAPIYLTACEYAMWMVLGSIHNFTLELETTSVPHPPNVVEVEPLPEHIAAARAADESAGAAVEDAAANEPSTSASSIPSYDPDSSPDIELAVVPPVRAKSGEGNNGPVQRRAVLESSHPPALESVAALPVGRRPIINSCGCSCTCMKCSKPPERYPSFRITACYLIGELVKTILEVVTVASVELSLALVLLATAPLFSVLFRFLLEHKRPTLQEACIIVIVFIGLGMRIPEIGNAPVGAVIGGLVSAASAAWISSFKSLIFDPPTAPHVLSYMYRFGPLLCVVTSVIMISTELSTLKHAFRSTDEAIETLSFGLMFAMLAAPSSVVSKRLQKLLGSFQRTLLGVANNVLVALVSIAVLGSADPTPLAIIGSLCVFLSPAIHFVNVEKWARKAWSGFQQTVIAVRRVVV